MCLVISKTIRIKWQFWSAGIDCVVTKPTNMLEFKMILTLIINTESIDFTNVNSTGSLDLE